MALFFVNFSDFPLLALVVEPAGTISLKIGKKHVSSLLDIKKNSVFFSTGTDTSGTKMGVTTNLSCLYSLYLSKQQFILKFSTFLAKITINLTKLRWKTRLWSPEIKWNNHLLSGSSEFDTNVKIPPAHGFSTTELMKRQFWRSSK